MRIHPKYRQAATDLLTTLNARQVAVAAAYLDGMSEEEIARREGVHQSTISRDLKFVRAACEKVGARFPEPERITAAGEEQPDDEVNEWLYGTPGGASDN